MKLQSLKHKILLPVIGTVMVVVILLSWLSFTSLRDATFNDSYEQLKGIGLKSAENIQFQLATRKAAVLGMAEQITGNITQALRQGKVSGQFNLAYYGEENGTMHDADPGFDRSQYDPRVRPWYIAAKQANALIVTKPYIASSSKQMQVTIAKPAGNGVVGGDMLAAGILEDVNRTKLPAEGYALLLHRDGSVIVVFRRRLHEISGVGCTARTGRLQGSVESGFSYLEACGGLADIQAVGDKLPRSLQLVGSDNRLASAFAPACGGSGQPGLGALADQVALELAQRTEHMEDEPSARRGGVDVFSQRAEADAPCFQLADRLNQVRQGAAKPIQPPDDQHIAIAQISQRIGQAGPVCLGPGCRVLENPFAACIAQRIRLQGGVLFRRRYPRIADECHFRPFVRYTVRLSYCPSSRCARCFRTGVRFGRLMIV